MAKAGCVVCEEYPYLGASADPYVHGPGSVNLYGLVEINTNSDIFFAGKHC